MKKTFALMLACCLLAGCSTNPELKDSGESYISSSVTSENNDSSEPESASSPSDVVSSQPQSSAPSSSSETAGEPQSTSSLSKPQSTASKPQSSSSSSKKPQSTASKPQSSSSSSKKPQSTASKPQSSSSSSKPQSTASKPQSSSSSSKKPQSSSSVPESKPDVPEVIGPYGQRAQEAWEVEFSNEVFRLTNIERVKNGLPEFKRLPLLDEAANVRAWEVLIKYGHTRPDGRKFSTALTETGISYSAAAENIAAGYTTPEDVVDGWMNSPGHRKNILTPELEYLGVGFYYDKDKISDDNYRYYWSQNFCATW